MFAESPCRYDRAHDTLSLPYSDASAKNNDESPKAACPGQARLARLARLGPEAAGTLMGTSLVTAHSQDVLRIDQNGKDAADTIDRPELIGVQAWLKPISKDGSVAASTFKLLTDSQVILQSIQKAIRQPATF